MSDKNKENFCFLENLFSKFKINVYFYMMYYIGNEKSFSHFFFRH